MEKYIEAAALVTHPETKESIEKITSEKKQTIESMHWVIMAEAGEIETEKPAPAAEGEAPASSASKCPFSGALAEMGIDITKMSKEEAMEKNGGYVKNLSGKLGLINRHDLADTCRATDRMRRLWA